MIMISSFGEGGVKGYGHLFCVGEETDNGV